MRYEHLMFVMLIRLEFHVDPSGIGFDLVNKIPITIGTIPLRAVFQTWPSYTPNPASYIPPPSADEGTNY